MAREQRKSVRIRRHFATQILNVRSNHRSQGVTDNVSQGGAFVKTKDWRTFRVNDRTVVTFVIAPQFSGQRQSIGLRGEAVISRVEPESEGVALQFTRSFHQLERVEEPEVAGKSRYKKLAYYLSLLSSLEDLEFIKSYPRGFLLEKSQRALDNKVIFQFSTESLDEEYLTLQFRERRLREEILEARVIEIKKRKLDSAPNTITIGRAAVNDIVLYNSMVSKSQAYLMVHPAGLPCYLVDAGSKNGTQLNGRPLKPHEKYQLADRDEICFGPQTRVVYFGALGFNKFLHEVKNGQPY